MEQIKRCKSYLCYLDREMKIVYDNYTQEMKYLQNEAKETIKYLEDLINVQK